jgi:hypothetical protein
MNRSQPMEDTMQTTDIQFVVVNGGTEDQPLWLVEDTHRDNELAWFEEGVSKEQVDEVARRANVGEITI